MLIFIYKKTEQTSAEFQIYALYPGVIPFNVVVQAFTCIGDLNIAALWVGINHSLNVMFALMHRCISGFVLLMMIHKFFKCQKSRPFPTQQFIAAVACDPADKGSSCACFREIVE